MKKYIKKCTACGRYTLKDVCPACGAPTRTAHPPPFSPEDRYIRLRLGQAGPGP